MEGLPDAVVQNILSRLAVSSFCSAASSCRLLYSCASQALPHLDCFHLLELSPRVDELKRMLCQNTQIRSLKIDCGHLDDEALSFLLKPCLEEIHLLNCEWFSARLFPEIGQQCPNLRSLTLELGWQDDIRGSGMHSVGLEFLLQQCSLLESLSLKGQEPYLDSDTYAAIPRLVSPTLTVLELGYMVERDAKLLLDYIQPHSLQGLKQRSSPLQNLHKLSLVLDRITDSLILLICQSLRCLSDLELEDEPAEEPLLAYDLTTTGVQYLGACLKLRSVMLFRSQDVYPATFKRVADLGLLFLAEKCTELESIKLGGFSRISDASCRHMLHRFPNLHTFELVKSPRVTDLTFRDFSSLPLRLVSVTLASCNLISNSSIKQLSYCEALENLNLKGCKSVGDRGLEAIATLSKLKTLNLNGVDVSDEGLLKLGQGSTPLVVLSLRGCQKLSNAGIAALLEGLIPQTLEAIDLSCISGLTDCAVLSLVHSGMKIVDLRLRDCHGIGDTSVIALASMTYGGCGFGGTLRLLDFWNCKGFTHRVVGWFKKPFFPRLRWLGLGWNSLSKAMLDFLSHERPYVHILDHGIELDSRSDLEGICGPYPSRYEQEDELERWIASGDEIH